MMNKRDVARAELARRKLARQKLLDFIQYTYPEYRASGVHALLATYLEAVESYVASGGQEGIGRLMVFMPPRHGKSEQVSVRFPVWLLGRNPDKRIILTSCTASLSEGFSRQARDIVLDNPYQAVFGVRSASEMQVTISDDSRSVSSWDLASQRGGIVAAGVGGSIIGKGSHLLVIDDPFKDRKDAESKTVRDGVDNWYRSTAYTRLAPGGAIVLMHQRWHEDDLAGRLLKRMVDDKKADRWTVLNLPAIAEAWAERVEPDEVIKACQQGWWKSVDVLGRSPGEPLWPEWFDLELLASIRVNLGGYEWDALYQQRPRPLEGALIKAYDIIQVRRSEAPEDHLLKFARYWDLAVSGREEADYIVGAKLGRARDGRIYVFHIARFKGPWADARPKMVDVMLRDGVTVEQGIETSGQQGGYFQELQRDERLATIAVKPVNPKEVGNKEVRANVWASRIPDGLIYLIRDGGWDVDGFLAEAVAFPKGAYDDQVDGVSGAVQMLGGWMGSFSDVPQDQGTGKSRWDITGRDNGQELNQVVREGVRWQL
jgi:predicted phage terminase large subunit-like protein